MRERKHRTPRIFISHAWGMDAIGRDNHERCRQLAKRLKEEYRYHIWIDHAEMYGNIDSAITKGINNSTVVLICLTEKYNSKINDAANNCRPNDNCYKEWNYSLFKQKLIIPVIMEESMKEIYLQREGIIPMYFHSTLFIDASSDIENATREIHETLEKHRARKSYNANNTKNSFSSRDYLYNILNEKWNRCVSPISLSLSPSRYNKSQKNIAKQISSKQMDNNIIDRETIIPTSELFLQRIDSNDDNNSNISEFDETPTSSYNNLEALNHEPFLKHQKSPLSPNIISRSSSYEQRLDELNQHEMRIVEELLRINQHRTFILKKNRSNRILSNRFNSLNIPGIPNIITSHNSPNILSSPNKSKSLKHDAAIRV